MTAKRINTARRTKSQPCGPANCGPNPKDPNDGLTGPGPNRRADPGPARNPRTETAAEALRRPISRAMATKAMKAAKAATPIAGTVL